MINFIHGTVRSGKTDNAIILNNSLVDQDKEVFMFTVCKNFIGSSETCIVSKNGLSATCIKIGDDFDFRKFFISKCICITSSVVIIDDCQFLSKFQIKYLSEVDTPVYMYGLKFDYVGNLFYSIINIISESNITHEIPSICESHGCVHDSTHNSLFIDDKLIREYVSDDLLKDGVYKPVCRHHFKYNIIT